MRKKSDRVTDDDIVSRAGEIIPVMLALDLPDPAPLWEAIKRAWSVDDLNAEIARFVASGDASGFRRAHDRFVERFPDGQWREKQKGYWKSEENVRAELARVIEKLGHWPSARELKEEGLSSLSISLKEFGGVRAFRQKLGYEPTDVEPDHWKSFENLAAALTPWIDDNGGRFPTLLDLQEAGLSKLSAPIRIHGGISVVRERMGHALSRRPVGFWKDVANVDRELENAIRSVGSIPTAAKLGEIGRQDLMNAISRNGGFSAARERLGLPPDPGAPKKKKSPNGTWSDVDRVVRATMELQATLGKFPTAIDFRERGQEGLLDAFYRLHGGLRAMRDRCEVAQSSAAPGYWREYDRIREAVDAWIAERGSFPTSRQLEKSGRLDMAIAISRHHGGYHALRKKMGRTLEAPRLPMGHWLDRDNVAQALNALIATLGHFPSQEEMAELGQRSLAAAIHKRHGGIAKIRKEMGYEERRRPNGHFDAFENLAVELERVIAELGHFPTHLELIELRASSLSPAIKLHGGFGAVRERMGYVPITDEILSASADALIPVVVSLELSETRSLWAAMKRRWTKKDLYAALAAFAADGTLTAFLGLLDS